MVKKDTFPKITPKTPKNFVKCLSFNDLLFWSSLWSGFGVALEWLWSAPKSLIFNDLQTSLKRLIFNGFTHLLVLCGWVKGRVLSKG